MKGYDECSIRIGFLPSVQYAYFDTGTLNVSKFRALLEGFPCRCRPYCDGVT